MDQEILKEIEPLSREFTLIPIVTTVATENAYGPNSKARSNQRNMIPKISSV
jgi:hypothetical protein